MRIYLSPPDVGAAEMAAVRTAMESGWVAPAGPELAAFESEVAKVCGMPHALAVNSGTAALHLALLALGVGPGDTVLCPSFTFAASLNPILYCGAQAELLDVDPQTWNVSLALLSERMAAARAGRAPRPKAIIACSIYGNCAGLAEIANCCREHGVPLIEDAAEALGASFEEQPAGSFGDLSVISFNGNKIITTSGGGMLCGRSADLIDRARLLSTQAREPVRHYEHRTVGYNYRMSNLLAALGRAQLTTLGAKIACRQGHFEAYCAAFHGLAEIEPMPATAWGKPNFWLSCFVFRGEGAAMRRDRLLDDLAAAGIEGRPLWKPLHLQPAYAGLPMVAGSVSEALFAGGFCLPSGSNLTETARAEVIARVRFSLSTQT